MLLLWNCSSDSFGAAWPLMDSVNLLHVPLLIILPEVEICVVFDMLHTSWLLPLLCRLIQAPFGFFRLPKQSRIGTLKQYNELL